MITHKYLYQPCPKDWKGKPFLSQENRQECLSANSKWNSVNYMMADVDCYVHDVIRCLDDDEAITIVIRVRADDAKGVLEAGWQLQKGE